MVGSKQTIEITRKRKEIEAMKNGENNEAGCELVPLLVICHECDAILYEGKELKSPEEIIEGYFGKCPTCSKKLFYTPKNVEVKPFDETNQPSRLERLKEKIRLKKRG